MAQPLNPAFTDPPAVVPPTISPGRTVGLFVRLRWRFQLNGLRTGGLTTLQTLLGLVMLPLLAGSGALLGVGLRTASSDDAVTAATIAAAFAGLLALVAPALITGHDDSLSPERLAPYPLPRGHRLAGLAAATAVGPIGIGTALAVAALAAGLAHTLAGLPLLVLAGAELWVLLTVTSRLLATALARLAATRRGRDINLALSALVAATAWVWGPLTQAMTSLDLQGQARVARIARWTPPGALGSALARAGTGSPAAALGGLALGGLGIAAAGGLWWLALGRASLDAGGGSGRGSGRAATVAAAGVPVGLFDGVLGQLPRTTTGAVAARELRLLARDPRRRMSVITLCMASIVLPVLNVAQRHPPPAATLAGAFVGVLVSLSAFNQLGTDGRALWFELLSGQPSLDNLRGRSLASFVTLAPVLVVSNVAVAALSHGWAYLPAAVLTSWTLLLIGLGLAAIASVEAPAPVPERGSPFGTSQGQGCLTGLLSLAGMVVTCVLMVPTAVALYLLRHRPAVCLVVALVSLAYGAGLRALCLRRAARRMTGREPELLAAVSPRG